MNTNKHANFFAPIFICLIFGSAIIVMFPMIFQLSRPSVAMDYESCAKLRTSRVQEIYPPICITADGKSYTKDLPAIKMPKKQ